MTQAERLARIEAILDRIEKKLDHVEKEQKIDIAEMAALKNRGAGILVGVAVASIALGASATSVWKWIVEIFT